MSQPLLKDSLRYDISQWIQVPIQLPDIIAI